MVTVDVACFRSQSDPTLPALQVLADAMGGAVVVGSAKLAQRVIVELLTEQNSQSYMGRGTPFLTQLRNGTYTEADVLAAFAASRNILKSNLQAEEVSTDAPSERYVNSAIDKIVVGPEFVVLHLNVTSRAGLTTAILMPPLVFTYG